MTAGAPPAGYVSIEAGRCTVVTLASHVEDARALCGTGTLYEGAANDIRAIPRQGRGVAYSIALPVSGTRVVVRHNRHGGMFAFATGDYFLPPTRAPYELATSERLRAAGVPTPRIIMHGISQAGGLFRRADVASQEIANGEDLSHYMLPGQAEHRAEAWAATRHLVRQLNAAGAIHHDLNVKNVLLSREGNALVAHVLDVDRVTFKDAASVRVARANAQRLLRSARKWRDRRGAEFDEGEIAALGIPLDQLQ